MGAVRTLFQLGLAIRAHRIEQGLSQAALARKADVSRRWINQIEAGKASAEIGLLLRVLDTLGLQFDIVPADMPRERVAAPGADIDLDAVLDHYAER